jgi:hypothetical protein
MRLINNLLRSLSEIAFRVCYENNVTVPQYLINNLHILPSQQVELFSIRFVGDKDC